MKTIIQRVKKASVVIDGKEKREIGQGLIVLAAFGKNDNPALCHEVFEKIKNMRIFSNSLNKMDLSVSDIKGEILIVSQFTLYANCKKGKRPDFTDAAPFAFGKELYDSFVEAAKQSELTVKTGEFGADMLLEIHNDGPVTIILDSEYL